MSQPNEPLPVLFRKMRGKQYEGEITAVFPTIPADYEGRQMTCYAHVGQHSGCDWGWYRSTRPAKPEEYAALLRELKGIYEKDLGGEGVYPLKVVQRITGEMRDAMRAEARKCRTNLKGN